MTGGKEKAMSSLGRPIKTAYPSPQAVDINLQISPETRDDERRGSGCSAAVRDVKQLTERHITVVCQNIMTPVFTSL